MPRGASVRTRLHLNQRSSRPARANGSLTPSRGVPQPRSRAAQVLETHAEPWPPVGGLWPPHDSIRTHVLTCWGCVVLGGRAGRAGPQVEQPPCVLEGAAGGRRGPRRVGAPALAEPESPPWLWGPVLLPTS